MGEPNATLLATVEFTRYDAGAYAGQLVAVGRRGQVRPKLGSTARHGKTPWEVSVAERPVQHGSVKTVSVEVPWRLSSQSLTEEEVGRVLDLARERVGDFKTID